MSTVKYYSTNIIKNWRLSVDGILKVSELVVEAENRLNAKEWKDLREELPIKAEVLSKLIVIGRHKQRFKSDRTRNLLPASYHIIHAFASLDDVEWKQALGSPKVVDPNQTVDGLRLWVNELRYGSAASTSAQQPATLKLGKGFFAGITLPTDIADDKLKQVETLVEGLKKQLQNLGVDIVYQGSSISTPRQQHIQQQKEKLAEKLEKQLSKFLAKHNKVDKEEMDLIESAYYQFRYHQEKGKYPYLPSHPESIERARHRFSATKLTFPEFMQTVRDMNVITSWTPIREYKENGEAKCLLLALKHTRAETSDQRWNYKKQLNSIVRRGQKNAPHAKKYIGMLVE